jgi:molybdenum cofactor cytidylyltransferase
MDKIEGILLAAGYSRRFGSDKLRYAIPQNEPVAVQSCRNLLAGTDKVLAVIRPGAEALAELLEKTGASIAICPDAEQGMGTSLAYAVSSLAKADGWLIALADMPWIRPSTICKVSEAIRTGATIAAPFWQEQRGHPVGFSRIFRDELMALTGDSGAKKLLEKYSSQIQRLDCDDPGVVRDIDVPSDLTEQPGVQKKA